MQTVLFAAILGLFTPLAVRAQLAAEAPSQEAERALQLADSLVADWVDEGRLPGAVLLVSSGGRIALEKAYGWSRLNDYGTGQYGAPGAGAIRRLQDPTPMTLATVFDLASVTKVMATTMAVMLLVDRGSLDLDAPVHTYLPDFRGGGKERITLRHLLTHRAGLHQWQPIYYAAENADDAYAYIRDLPLAWDVAEGRHYSDLGFIILGRIVERVAAQPLDEFLHEQLYAPLDLAATGFRRDGQGTAFSPSGPFAATSHGNPYERRMVHDVAFGYVYGGDPTAWSGWRRHMLVGEVNDGNSAHAFAGVAGHAGLFSTARDLQVLLQLLLDGGEHAGRRYIGRGVVDAFLTSTGEEQALGWQTPSYAPSASFLHTGFTGTFVMGLREVGLGVVLLTNRQNLGVDEQGYYPDVGPLQRSLVDALTGAW